MTWWLFQSLVIATVLAGVAVVAIRTLRLGPVAAHALWAVVLFKLVTPPLGMWPVAMPDPLGLAPVNRVDADRDLDADIATLSPGAAAFQAAAPDPSPATMTAAVLPVGADVIGAARQPSAPNAKRVRLATPALLAGVWAAGALMFALVQAIRIARLARRIRRATPPDAALAARVAELGVRLGLARPVRVRVAADGAAPLIWAAFHPTLVWPAELPEGVSDACRDGLIVHELAHVKRRDHVVGWIELIAGLVWWWNPLYWYVRAQLREHAELACDGWVVNVLPDGRRAYAESVLACSAFPLPRHAAPMPASGISAASRRSLERRLTMIMQGRTPISLTRTTALCLGLVAVVSLPGWAQQTAPLPAQSTPVVVTSTTPAPAPVVTTVQPAPAAVPMTEVSPVAFPVAFPLTATSRMPAPMAQVPVLALPSIEMPLTAPAPLPVPVLAVAPEAQTTTSTPVPARKSGFPAPPQVRTPSPSPTYTVTLREEPLPADAQKLVDQYTAERKKLEDELEAKMAAQRQDLIKRLQDLQTEYTKAGKLDEAVAVRARVRALESGRDDRLFRTIPRRDGGAPSPPARSAIRR